jgi:hypothetical protein
VAPLSEPRHTVRWVAIAAVMLLAVAGGVVWSLRVEHPVTPANQPTPVDDRPGLGVYLLPSSLPAGWRLVDISETAADNTGVMVPHNWLIAARAGAARAVLSVYPRSQPSTDATDAATATTAAGRATGDARWTRSPYRGTGLLWWTEQGQDAGLAVFGLDEAQARALHDELHPDRASGDLVYSLPKGSSFRIERDLGRLKPDETGSATLTFVDRDGKLGMLGLQSGEHAIDVLLDPSIVGAPAVAQIDVPSGEVFGAISRSDVSASFWSPSPAGAMNEDEVRAVLDSLAPVDHAVWVQEIAGVGDALETQQLVGSSPVTGGTLTIRREDDRYAVCLRLGVARGCRAAVDPNFLTNGGRLADLSLTLLVGGEWVVVRGVDAQDAAGPVEVDVAGVRSEIVSTEVGSFAVMTVPAGVNRITFSIGVQGQRMVADETAIRPIR